MRSALRLPAWALCAVAAVALAAAFGIGQPRAASAHAVLERSLPAQNQQLSQPPELVETWYTEPLERQLTTLRVLDMQGAPVHVGETLFSETDALYAAVALPPDLAPGIYTTVYQNVSTVDGHAWTGSFSFIVLNEDGSVPAGSAFTPEGLGGTAQGYLPGIGDSTLRWLGLLASIVVVGAAAFYLFVARPSGDFLEEHEQRGVEDAAVTLAADLVIIAVPVLVLSLVGQLFLLADRLGGRETVDDILFSTRTGELWIARLGLAIALALLFVPALISAPYRSGGRAGLLMAGGLLGGLGLLVTYSLGSHAGTGGGEFWSVGADFVHFAATAAWLGALLQLPLLFWWTRARLDDTKRLLYTANGLDRFAWLAVISVTLLIGSGAFNGFVQLPTLESLWDTTYGRVLLAKLSLILPLLGVAGINAIFLSPALSDAIDALYSYEPEERAHGAEEARFARQASRLQRVLPWTIAAELTLGAAVLVSVALLTQTTTAEGELREVAGRPSGQFAAATGSAGLDVELQIEPFGLGQSTFTTTLRPQAGGALAEVLGVRLRAFFDDPNAPAGAGSGATTQELSATEEPAVWSADAALLTQPGDWRIEARIRQRGLDDVVTNFNLPEVGGPFANAEQPDGLFDLPFTTADWNLVAGAAIVALGVGVFLVWYKRPPTWERGTGWSVLLASGVAVAAGVVLIVGMAPDEGIPRRSPVPATQESLAEGRRLFEVNCTVCHGVGGRGDGPQAAALEVPPADLTQHVPFHSDRDIFRWISVGLPLRATDTAAPAQYMPGFQEALSEEERWHLVNFLRNEFGHYEFTPVRPDDNRALAAD